MVSADNDSHPSNALEQRSKALFDASVTHLEAGIRSRLTQARHAAVDTLKQPEPFALRKWVPVAGAAAIALAVTVVLFTGVALQRPSEVTLAADDLALLLEDDNLDLIEEIDFYTWLDGEIRSDPS